MTILYEGYTISGTPSEIKEFLMLMTTTTVDHTDINSYINGIDLKLSAKDYNACEEVYWHGKSIYDCSEDELREAMTYEHLDRLCDTEIMTREEMIRFIDAYFRAKI